MSVDIPTRASVGLPATGRKLFTDRPNSNLGSGVPGRGPPNPPPGPVIEAPSGSLKAEVRRSVITTTVRDQSPRSHHKGVTGRVRTGDKRYPALYHCQLGQDRDDPYKAASRSVFVIPRGADGRGAARSLRTSVDLPVRMFVDLPALGRDCDVT